MRDTDIPAAIQRFAGAAPPAGEVRDEATVILNPSAAAAITSISGAFGASVTAIASSSSLAAVILAVTVAVLAVANGVRRLFFRSDRRLDAFDASNDC